jgi:ribosomal protein S17E
MTKERLLTIAVVFLLLLNVIVIGSLFTKKQEPVSAPELHKVLVQELNLDEAQQKKFFYLRDQHHEMIEDLDKKFKRTFDAYLELLKTESEITLDSLENQMGMLEKTKASITWQHFQHVKELCNDEQKKKFDELIPQIANYIGRERDKRPNK